MSLGYINEITHIWKVVIYFNRNKKINNKEYFVLLKLKIFLLVLNLKP